jgi:hypothetical protein
MASQSGPSDEELLTEAIARLCAGDDSDQELIEAVARATPESLRPFHNQLVDAEAWLWPWTPLWVAATEETAARLAAQVDADTEMSERWLRALGVSRTQTAAMALSRWTDTPPPVAAHLYIPIAQYAHEGGWELGPVWSSDLGGTADRRRLAACPKRPQTTENEGAPDRRPGSPLSRSADLDLNSTQALADGAIRPLTSLTAYALTATDSHTPLAGSAPLGEHCPWCGLELLRRLDVDLDDPRLADLGLTGHGRVIALTCIGCGGYTHIFGEYQPNGTATWSASNTKPTYLPPAGDDDGLDMPTGRLDLGPRRPSPVAGIAWDAGGSTLGGLPDWIQDATYPTCPHCRTTMYFLAMLTGDDLWGESAEGCDYVFFCTSGCKTTAVVYQQS